MGTIEPIEETSTHSTQRVSKITNKILLKELVEHFNEQMDELSVGKRLLYPMSFNILMHPDDYALTKESLPFVLPEVISEFYAAIKKRQSASRDKLNFTPPATYWFFQFSACQIGGQAGEENFIQRGQIVTTGSLTTFDIYKAQGNVRSEANVHLSVKCQNSNTNDNNINIDAILGMEILSEGSYTFPFDMNLNEDTAQITANTDTQRKPIAQLRWSSGSHNMVYDMLDNYIDISGMTDTRKTRNICHIADEAVNTSHVQIKYDPQQQVFFLAAYAKTRLNSREVPMSSGGIPQWVSLSKNSRIFLNDSVSVEFNAL